jgi:hypothetical protein
MPPERVGWPHRPPVAADQIDRLLSLLLDGLRQPAPPA